MERKTFNPATGFGSVTVSKPLTIAPGTLAEVFGPNIPPRRIRMLRPTYTLEADGTFRVTYPFEMLRPPPESPGLAAYVDAVLGID